MNNFFDSLIGWSLVIAVVCIGYNLLCINDVNMNIKQTNVLLERNNKLLEQIELRIVNVQNRF